MRAVFIHAAALVWTLSVLVPFAWLLISSFSTQVELLSKPPHWIPQQPTLDNYAAIFSQYVTGHWSGSQPELIRIGLRNSLILGSAVVVVNLPLGSLAGYAFAKMRFPLRRTMLVGLLFTRLVPVFAIIIPFYIVFRQLRLLDSIAGLVVADLAVTLPFTIWIMKAYFETVPVELELAARLDGCSRLQVLWYIALPLALPALIAAGVFAFMTAWNEFILAVTLTSTPEAMPVQPAIAGLYQITRVEFGVMMSGAVLAAIPPMLVVLLFQRYLVTGLMTGASKG